MDLFKSITAAEFSWSSSSTADLQPGPGLAATDSMLEHSTGECESDVQQRLGDERANGGRSEESDESKGEDLVVEEQPARVCSPPSFLFFLLSTFFGTPVIPPFTPSTLPRSPSRHFMQVDFEVALMPSDKRANRHEVISRMCQKNR